MRTLYLLRHAKTERPESGVDDHDRRLTPRGVRDAAAAARHLVSVSPAPQLVLCSSAVRARQTLEPIAAALPATATVSIEPGLYGAASAAIMARLRRVPADTSSVLVIGHNPAVHELAVALTGAGDPELVAMVMERLPTAALVTLESDEPWPLRRGRATLRGLVLARQSSGGA